MTVAPSDVERVVFPPLSLVEVVGWLRGWGGINCFGGFFFECWVGRACCLYSGVLEVTQSQTFELFEAKSGVRYLKSLAPGLCSRVGVAQGGP